jgi:chemotaxis protein MotA
MATAPHRAPAAAHRPADASLPAAPADTPYGGWQKPPKRLRRHLDFSTLAGISLALGGLIGGLLLEHGNIQDIAQMTAALIVLGGTFGAVLVTTPLHVVLRAFRRLGDVFLDSALSHAAVIDNLIWFASKARRDGIVSLEQDAESIPDPFMRKALNLAVDGTDLQELRKMMEIDLTQSERLHEAEARVWESAGGYAPTIGIIGAVMGLIQVMKHLEDMTAVGHGIAVAFVATVYGVGSANIFFLPAANKLRAKLRERMALQEMILEGVAAIVEGLNPTLIRLKLESFDPRREPPKANNDYMGPFNGPGMPPRR